MCYSSSTLVSTLIRRKVLLFHYITIHSILCFVSVRSVGFSIPLIPRFSEESPFYQGNLTTHHKIHDLIKLSLLRPYKLQPENIRLPVHGPTEHTMYVTKLTIGSPPTIQTLILDTGSGIIWTQCKGCTKCFNQTAPLFDPTHSSSYKRFPPVLPHCKSEHYDIVDGKCKFEIKYSGGSFTSGVVSREKFTFDKVEGGHHVFKNMIFGCATDSEDIYFSGGEVSGMVGLSTFRHSLPQQLSSMIHGRFSYCLKEGLNISTVMKFGEDVVMPSGHDARAIPFVKQNIFDLFFLNLVDISVGRHRIRFPRGTFTLRKDGSRGCIIDSGSGVSYIHEGPYEVVMTKFDHHFTERGLERLHNLPDVDLEYCYKIDPHFNDYIGMTFHFAKGGDYVVPWKYMYSIEQGFFCVALFPSNETTIIGAWQQQNMLLVYDLNHQMLHFKPDPCNG